MLSSTAMTQVFADDWPQWRGANRDGKSAEQNLADTWSADGPKLLWQATELGGGYSTPSAANGVLYVLANKGTDKEDLIAISLADGKKMWSMEVGPVGKNEGPQYPGTRSTPTIDGDTVYVLGSAGDLLALEAGSGKKKWHKNMARDFQGQVGMWAYTESPLIDGDKLICSPGGANATVIALNKQDGELIWKSSLPEADKASYSSPIKTEVDGREIYVLFLGGGVVGLDAASGEYLWRYSHTADQAANVQTPIAWQKYVYTGAGRVGGGLIEIVGAKKEPQEIYFNKKLPTGMGGAVLVDGYLYGSSGETVLCVDYKTGESKWQERSIGASSICYADGKLFLHGENNEVAMIAATHDGYKELGRVTPPNATDRGSSKAWVHPIIVDGKLIIRDMGNIWAYNITQ